MKLFKLALSIFTIITLLIGCKKKNLNIEEGTYSGTLTVTYDSGFQKEFSTFVELGNSIYTCTSRGSGTYSIEKDKIVFNDEKFWTADFDWNLILDGQYDYTFTGEKLNISANKNDIGYFEYNLVKE